MPAVQPYPITACSLCNALGTTTAEVVSALDSGRSGLETPRIELPFPTVCGNVTAPLPRPPRALARFDSRLLRMALLAYDGMASAVEAAVARWGSDRVAVILGTSTGGIEETEAAHAAHLAQGAFPPSYDFRGQHPFDAFAEALARVAGATGPRYVISTACSSSGKALAVGQRLLRSAVADAVLAGGVDGLCQTTLRGFHSLSILSSRPCRPFGLDRDGITIGEGAALMLLERGGEAPVRLLAVGESSDAHHMSTPDPEGRGARAAMARALEQAGLPPSEVDHVNAHGTGTPRNDASEARAIAELLGADVLVASTKGYTGHLLGAGGTTEAIFSLVALERGRVPASLGAHPLDPSLGVNVTLAATTAPVRTVLSNSFGFGGSNVSVLLGATP